MEGDGLSDDPVCVFEELIHAPQAVPTYCISYGLLRASHSRNLTGIRTSVPLVRHFVLIPVAFEIAYSLLHTLRA